MSESAIRFIDPPVPNERLLAYEISGDFTGDDMRTFVERLEKIANSGQKALRNLSTPMRHSSTRFTEQFLRSLMLQVG